MNLTVHQNPKPAKSGPKSSAKRPGLTLNRARGGAHPRTRPQPGPGPGKSSPAWAVGGPLARDRSVAVGSDPTVTRGFRWIKTHPRRARRPNPRAFPSCSPQPLLPPPLSSARRRPKVWRRRGPPRRRVRSPGLERTAVERARGG
jgi:hypothetical protein